jgi:hypothetical protein
MRVVILSSFFLFFLITNKSYGQEQFYLGLKTGIGFSFEKSYTNGARNNFQYQVLKCNFNGGIELNIIMSKTLSIESEIIFEDKGYRGFDDKHGLKQNITRAYAQFPELLRYTFNIEGENKIKPFVEVGIYFAYHLFTTNTVSGDGLNYNLDPVDEAFNKFEWGATGGMGVIKKAGRGFVSINARYDHSITNALVTPTISVFNSQTNQYITYENKFLFSVLSFTINYTYPLKRE